MADIETISVSADGTPIVQMKVIDKDTGTETPVNVETCTQAVKCSQGIPVEEHLANLYAHANDEGAHLSAGEKAEFETKTGAQTKADNAENAAVAAASLLVESAKAEAATDADEKAKAARNAAYRYTDETATKLQQFKAGLIYPLASAVIPVGFLLCDGAAYSRTEYPELFAAIGTIYGRGDGKTTFNVPNLTTRVPVGAGGNYELGQTGGEETHTLSVEEMPSHKHMFSVDKNSNYRASWVKLLDTTGGSTGAIYISGRDGETDGVITADYTGDGTPHNNMQPYTVVNYIIATGKDTAVSVHDIVLGAQAIPLEVQYGGTGATSVAQARENLGLKKDLLWENASASSELSAQTIPMTMDVSEYSEYIVQTLTHGQFRTKIGSYIHMGYNNVSGSSNFVAIYNRGVVLHASGELEIKDCRAWNKGDSVPTTVNTALIIAAVYGIKEVDE